MNMGTMLLVFCFYCTLFILYPCCRALRNDAKCARKNTHSMHKMLFWSHPILFLQEGYLDILIAASINMIFLKEGELGWSEVSLIFTNVLSILMIAACSFLFFFVAIYLWPRFEKLKTRQFRKKYKPIYEMLNLRRGRSTLLWPLIFMLRRALFVVAVCALADYTEMQIYLFMLPTIASMTILASVNPLESITANRLEIFNSVSILLMSYCLMAFTPLVLDPQARYTMGFVMVGLTGTNVLTNIIVISIDPMRKTCMRCKVHWG